MELEEIALESIDFTKQTYRISETLESPALESSLRAIGQLNPVVLLDHSDAPKIVVCGFRRLHALQCHGKRTALARILPPTTCRPLEVFRIALWDNLSHRKLNAFEKAKVLQTLKHTCGVEHDTLVGSYLPLLDLAPHKRVLRSYLGLHALLPDLKRFFLEGRLTLSSAETLSMRSSADQKTLAGVLEKARWSASLQRQLLDLLEELAALGDCTAAEVLGGPEIAAVLDDFRVSPFQKGERVYEILYRRRNPRLSRAQERFRTEREKLGLPGAVRLTPEPFFESSRIRVEFDACSAANFREISAELQRAAQASELDDLFRVS